MTNFGAVSIVERVVCGKSDGNIKHSHGQAFPCEVFSNFTKGQNYLPKSNSLEPLIIWSATIKLTNLGTASIVEWVMCGKSDGNIKHSHGQAWPTRIEIKFLAHMSAEKILLKAKMFCQNKILWSP